jgi:hypothetical protein
VLSLQPTRTGALEGREDALFELLQQAAARIEAGRLAEAAGLVARAGEFDPGHVALPDARAALARAADALRGDAERALRQGALDAAAAAWREVLALEPDDSGARAGLLQVARAHLRRSEGLAADFRFREAERELGRARVAAPDASEVAQAERRLAQARRRQQQLAPPRPDRGRLRDLLARAEQAQARGDLLQPPGESAYDLLRAARAQAPDDAEVARMTRRVLAAARECHQRDLTANRLTRAQACLDAYVQLGGSDGVGEAKRRLATRWVAVGNERVGAGELEVAARARDAARALDPIAPGLAALEARLRAATAVHRR